MEQDGGPHALDCAFRYFQGEKILAIASIFRDRYSLEVEADMAAEQTG
ncbi:MAG: hypothetical protein WCB49_08635 [Gammaproteobacteria bacterium]